MEEICKRRNCNETIAGRKQYCSDSCRYWEGQMRKDDEKYLPPSRKRNKGWMKMYTGQTVRANSGARQGKRIGGTIIGSMSAFVYMPVG